MHGTAYFGAHACTHSASHTHTYHNGANIGTHTHTYSCATLNAHLERLHWVVVGM